MNRLSISLVTLVSTLALEASARAQAALPEPSAPAAPAAAPAASAPSAAPTAAPTAAPAAVAPSQAATQAAPIAPTSRLRQDAVPASAGPKKETMFRLGIDGQLQAGLAVATIVSLRLEAGSRPSTVFTFRAGGFTGANVTADEGAGFTGAHAHLGLRRYWGMGFAGFEVGAMGWRDEEYMLDDERHGGDLTVLPNIAGTAGVKMGPVELSLNAMLPFATVGIGLGLDLGSSFPSITPEPRKQRRAK